MSCFFPRTYPLTSTESRQTRVFHPFRFWRNSCAHRIGGRYNTDKIVNGIGREFPSPYNPVGPTINGVIDCRVQDNPLDGFVIEEGAVPHALSHLLQTMLDLMPGRVAAQSQSLYQRTQSALARYGSRFIGPYFSKGAVEKTQIYLIMSHDSSSPFPPPCFPTLQGGLSKS